MELLESVFVRPRQALSMQLCFRHQSIGPEVGTNLRQNKLPHAP
jgi:hypothetical protein